MAVVPRLVSACRREPLDRPPVWLMRQAGRHLPEYRAIRAKHGLLDICADVDLTVDVTLQPVRRYGVDAAIIFADIMLPLLAMGVDLRFEPGVGPVIDSPVRNRRDVQALRPLSPGDAVPSTLEAIRAVRAELPAETAVIGFAGGPFTLASYLIEGGPTRRFLKVKEVMYREPDLFAELLDLLADAMASYLGAQASSGADVLQVFDSWVGCLSPDDYERHVAPSTRRLFAALEGTGVPAIHFGTNTGGLLRHMRQAGGDVIGVDWRVPLDRAWDEIGPDRGVQGNLDPAVLLAEPAEIRAHVRRLLALVNGRPGYIANLGHGVLPETPVEGVEAFVDAVLELSGGSERPSAP